MRRAWMRFADFVSARTLLVLGAALVLTLVLAIGLPQLEFATGQDSYLNEGEQVAVDNEEYQDLFGGQAMLTLFTADEGNTVVDLFTARNIEQWREAADEIRAVDGVDGVISPLTALEWTQNLVTPQTPEGELRVDDEGNPVYQQIENPDGSTSVPLDDVSSSAAGQILLRAIEREQAAGDAAAASARLADSERTLERLSTAVQGGTSFENAEWVEFLLVDNQGDIRAALRPVFQTGPDVEPTLENARFAGMVTRLSGNQGIEDEGEASDAVVATLEDLEWDNGSAVTTGAPVLLKDLNDYLQGGMLTLGAIAVVIMLVILFVVFRVRWRLLSLGVVLAGIIWTFGLLGLIGFDLSLVTISGLPILIGLGIDFSIQIHNRVEEEVVIDHERTPFAETLRNMGPALLIAVIAAIAAFTAMQWSAVPMVRDFGILLSVGIAIVLGAGLALPTAVLGARERRSPTTHEQDHRVVEKSVVWLGSLPRWTVIPMMVLGVGLFGFGILAEDAFEIETDPERWVNQDTEVIRDLRTLQDRTGSSSELGVFVTTQDGVFTDEVGSWMTDFAFTYLDEEPQTLLTASSLPTTIAYLMEVPDASVLAPTGEDLQLGYEVAPPDIQTSVVADEGEAANIIFRTGPSALEVRRQVVEDMESRLVPGGGLEPPAGIRAVPSGLAVVGIGLLENIEENRTELTYIALGLALVWLLVRFRSPGKTLITLVPVLLAVGTSSLVIAAAGFKLSPLTTISGPLVIATCTEFSVLITTRYLEERRRGLAAREATDVAAARTGRAFVASALTTVGGFGVLIFSALPLLRDFGAIVTLNIAVALLSALVVVPPMLVWSDEKRLFRPGGAPRGVGPIDAPEGTGQRRETLEV